MIEEHQRPLPIADDGPAISVSDLSKQFGARVAFEGVSFEVARGEVFGFLGPNGAGKTTTVRTLGTLIAPTSGSASVAGLPLTPGNAVRIRRRIAIMPESPGIYLRLSVLENLEYFADLYEVPDPRRRIDRALRAVELTERAHDLCGTLSKGVASAILRMPDIIAQLLLTPLLAGWSIWVGIAISVRSSDVRVAQQLSLLANLPLILVASMIAFDTIHPTPVLAIGLTSVLLIADALGWRIVAPMFDRERLITGPT
jgi:ABC-type transport system involved in cytochrome c biogenesis ATPase subunit